MGTAAIKALKTPEF